MAVAELDRERAAKLVPPVLSISFLSAILPALAAQPGWRAETPHFRVLVSAAPGLGPETAQSAAEALECFRKIFESRGVGTPVRSDGQLDVLVLPSRLELHALLREPPSSRTRGVTVRGLDRDFVAVPWHGAPGPRVTLAHEYAHQFDRSAWPVWYREGRAVFLAREIWAGGEGDARLPLLETLDTSEWLDWGQLLDAERGDEIATSQLFQTQAWLLVHWLSRQAADWAPPDPSSVHSLLDALGSEGLTETLRYYLQELQRGKLAPLLEVGPADVHTPVAEAQHWEIPLFMAEVGRELRHFDLAEPALREIAAGLPDEPLPQAALGTLLVLLGRSEAAEDAFKAALSAGDPRARTAYRYAVLMMRPGENPQARASEALDAALRAVRLDPHEPTYRLALVHARMLRGDWPAVFRDLRALASFPEWSGRAAREAAEARRRRDQSILAEPRPRLLLASAPTVHVELPESPPAWREPAPAKAPIRRLWPPEGAWLVHGKIAWVDCSGGSRTVIVHTPYRRYSLAENPDSPPRLINRPFRMKQIPCNTRGYSAAVAFKKLPAGAQHDGELVGIRF
ncbi:MAG: hypothetical protein OXN89_21485 [Bryobacterales bacterium]|nr:hypothetical protein [Bryobacterales bacterium]